MAIEWPMAKAMLLFGGLVLKGLALSAPLPFDWGKPAKAVAAVLWPAFDGAFLWLLRPPSRDGQTEGRAWDERVTPKVAGYAALTETDSAELAEGNTRR